MSNFWTCVPATSTMHSRGSRPASSRAHEGTRLFFSGRRSFCGGRRLHGRLMIPTPPTCAHLPGRRHVFLLPAHENKSTSATAGRSMGGSTKKLSPCALDAMPTDPRRLMRERERERESQVAGVEERREVRLRPDHPAQDSLGRKGWGAVGSGRSPPDASLRKGSHE
jgi:hypothetical protein